MIIVYTKNGCPKCEEVKHNLKCAEAAFEVRNIENEKHPEYREEFDKMGFMAAPVTVFPSGNKIPGFDMKKFSDELGF